MDRFATVGFIGMGNMAQALCAGFVKSGMIEAENIMAYAPNQEKLKGNAEKLGFTPYADIIEMAAKTDIFVMACKPYQIEGVLSEIGDYLKGKTLISVALGWNHAKYRQFVDASVKVQFIMPNTPAMVGEGVFLFEKTNSLDVEMHQDMMELFATMGLVEELPDNLMGIGGAVTGCGPAFVDLMIEAYADAAVKYGIPRQTAYKLVSQMIAGSAKLQLETGEHPGVLKDNVCSPGGSTIRGVSALEAAGFRDACIHSIDTIMDM